MQQALSKMDEMLHALDNGTFLTTSVGDDLIANLCFHNSTVCHAVSEQWQWASGGRHGQYVIIHY